MVNLAKRHRFALNGKQKSKFQQGDVACDLIFNIFPKTKKTKTKLLESVRSVPYIKINKLKI